MPASELMWPTLNLDTSSTSFFSGLFENMCKLRCLQVGMFSFFIAEAQRVSLWLPLLAIFMDILIIHSITSNNKETVCSKIQSETPPQRNSKMNATVLCSVGADKMIMRPVCI